MSKLPELREVLRALTNIHKRNVDPVNKGYKKTPLGLCFLTKDQDLKDEFNSATKYCWVYSMEDQKWEKLPLLKNEGFRWPPFDYYHRKLWLEKRILKELQSLYL
tara:strand:- start:84 stop:398 length:315 start_codon:yes stop_codon:yes gene_type:complete